MVARDKAGRTLLLTTLSGVELVGLLAVLFWFLGEIRSALERVQNSLAHITWGVRAIETQTEPLSEQRSVLHRHLIELADNVDGIASRLGSSQQHLTKTNGQ
jgi:hypothetical protein